jgi:hypothetical protein
MSSSIDLEPVVAPATLEGESESLGHALSLRCSWQSWLRRWLDESPSWLVSLIFHLVAFLVITSIAAPFPAGRSGGSGEISLIVGFAKRTQSSQGPEVTIEPSEVPASGASEAQQPDQGRPVDGRPANAEAPSTSQSVHSLSAASRTARRPSTAWPTTVGIEPTPSLQVSPYAALLNRHHVSPGTAVAASAPQLHAALRPLTPESLDPEQRELDRIVDNFIAYDVGQLRGAAGAQARQRFAQLGPEAIPALVRGLNKSAGIHASCPVGVIASKLMSTLQSANDPSLRQYAIDHVGVDVPETAPHFKRLVALRNNWLGAPAMPTNVAAVVDRLSDAPSDTIVAALRSGDSYLGAAAALAILQGPHSWDAQQRGQLRAALVHFLSTTTNPQIRSLAVDAQHALRR